MPTPYRRRKTSYDFYSPRASKPSANPASFKPLQPATQAPSFSDKSLHESTEFKQKRRAFNTSFQNLVEVAANRFGMGKQLHSIRICHECRKIVRQIFPNAKPEQLQVISFLEGTLNLAAGNSTWSHQATMNKHKIIEEINKKIGAGTVQKINLRTISAPTP